MKLDKSWKLVRSEVCCQSILLSQRVFLGFAINLLNLLGKSNSCITWRIVWENRSLLQNFILCKKLGHFFYIHGSMHRESFILITVQQDAAYSVYYISVGSSTCFGCWHPSSGARTTVITASGTGQPSLLPSAPVVEFQLNNESFWHWSTGSTTIRSRCWVGTQQPVPEAVITVVRAPDDECQQPKHVELPTEI